jgi:hypothetical protein
MPNINFEIRNKTLCLCARRNSGKSQLLRYIIMQNRHLFKAKFLICPTEKINKFYEGIFKPENVYETYSDNWVTKLMDKLSKENEGKKDKEASHV